MAENLLVPPHEAEWAVLGASGLSRAATPWRIYHRMAGDLADGPPAPAEMTGQLIDALVNHMQRKHGAFVYFDEENVAFAPGIDLAPILRIGVPGALPVDPDAPLMIEMPDMESYRHSWGEAGEAKVPFAVRARANMRMAATGSATCLIWLVADMGAIDAYHRLELDTGLVTRLQAAVGAMAERVRLNQEPDPEDEDLDDKIRMLGDRSNSLETVSRDDAIVEVAARFQEAASAKAAVEKAARDAKATFDGLKNQLLRRLLKAPRIKLPDGTILTSTWMSRKGYAMPDSGWHRIDFERPKRLD